MIDFNSMIHNSINEYILFMQGYDMFTEYEKLLQNCVTENKKMKQMCKKYLDSIK